MKASAARKAHKSSADTTATINPFSNPAIPKEAKGKPPIGFVACPIDDPLAYGLIVEGDCLHPLIQDGDFAIVSPLADVVEGTIVAFSFLDGRQGSIKRLAHLPPKPHPDDEIEELIRVEMDNPPKTFFLSRSVLDKMHAVVGVVRKGEFIAIDQAEVA